MRSAGSIALGSALFLTAPAAAASLASMAKTVLESGATLYAAEAKCGIGSVLAEKDALALTYARAAAEQALTISQFMAADEAAKAKADSAALGTSFCADTIRKKASLMSRTKRAADGIVKKKKMASG